jgi:cobalamin biosynthesis Mg chelatase CobN
MHRALRPPLLLLAALPLLALALAHPAPSAAASCGATSAENTYCLEPAEIESGESIKHPETPTTHHHAKPAHHSTTPKSGDEAAEKAEPGSEAEPKSGEGHHSKVAPPAKGGNHPGGGKPGHHAVAKHPATTHQGAGKSTSPKSEGPTTKGVPASASTGGSSPVLPILVAVVVLAAISIGIVVYRERKGGNGPAGYTGARG